MSRYIKIFDTTLRDGEQSPGCSMNLEEKLEMARQLEMLGVDIIEAGFAIASTEDFESVRCISQSVNKAVVASLCRAVEKDIDRAWEAVKYANHPRIHTFLATSAIHMKYKLKMSPNQVLTRVEEMVAYAKRYCDDVEFSAEDASRSDIDFLVQVCNTAIRAGATTLNIPDTVGYAMPEEMFQLISRLREKLISQDIDISVHCHNDLGLATANSLAAIRAGATQVECTINGIGERAGNASMEEIVMNLHTRKDYYNAHTNIQTRQIYKASKLLSTITGVAIPPNKPIVGANAFAHESGIHQHGMLNEKSTYEIMSPEDIGIYQSKIILGKHSGRHAFEEHIESMGYELAAGELDKAFENFKKLADRKKNVTDKDIEALVRDKAVHVPEVYTLVDYVVNSGSNFTTMATVKLKREGKIIEKVATGDGPVNAAFKAIEKIIKLGYPLDSFAITAVTEGKDALGETTVKIKADTEVVTGRGLSTDIIEASIKAYLNSANKILSSQQD